MPKSTYLILKIGSFCLNSLDEQRFWNNIQKDSQTDCWLWTGGPNFSFSTTSISPRRLAALLTNNDVPENGKKILLSCMSKNCVNPAHTLTTYEQRFWDKVDKDGPICIHHKLGNLGNCWIWKGSLVNGYAQCQPMDGEKNGSKIAVILLTGKAWPFGKWACHHCDNPPCVNPTHVFAGTRYDNIQDAVEKGRTASGDRNVFYGVRKLGEYNPSSKLTSDIVKKSRKRYETGKVTMYRLAKECGVTFETMKAAVMGDTWKHVS